jgi:DNA-directed RNA polymerase subunit RPC12/RpoP
MANCTHQISRQTRDKRTTLNPAYLCDDCGKPAMTNEAGRLSCPACYLKKLGKQIKPLDHAGFYP